MVSCNTIYACRIPSENLRSAVAVAAQRAKAGDETVLRQMRSTIARKGELSQHVTWIHPRPSADHCVESGPVPELRVGVLKSDDDFRHN